EIRELRAQLRPGHAGAIHGHTRYLVLIQLLFSAEVYVLARQVPEGPNHLLHLIDELTVGLPRVPKLGLVVGKAYLADFGDGIQTDRLELLSFLRSGNEGVGLRQVLHGLDFDDRNTDVP